jgi:hypothetical protein
MLAVWDPTPFQAITDYYTWSEELEDDVDIQRHVDNGSFVPVNIGSDGSFEFELRLGTVESPAKLSDREKRYGAVTSEAYLLHSTGIVCVSGIEMIEMIGGAESSDVGQMSVPAGDYAVTVNMISWDEEPGARGADGKPTANALPDFVILINPAGAGQPCRRSLKTFDRPGG